MPHHKRRRPKNRRAGCLLCKSHKVNGVGQDSDPIAARRRMQPDEARPAALNTLEFDDELYDDDPYGDAFDYLHPPEQLSVPFLEGFRFG